jgi:triphosphoribosyl-dephospho-CoA synthase
MSSALQHAYLQACLAELEALKPGNVHIFADGHGMQVQDFIASAEVSAPALCDDEVYGQRTLGQRTLQALQATYSKVGCNTNLGIVLLAAPLVQARLQFQELPLQTALHQVLQQTTVEDAACVYEGIRLVSPAGIGQRDAHDVSQPPQITLLHAMQLASQNDMVAQQYVDAYATIFSTAMPLYEVYSARWERSAWALTAIYLYWLSSVPDSHIQRKYGADVASQIQHTAGEHYTAFTALENPKHYMPALLKWDAELKQARINPGTSADLTVITAMISSLINAES